MSVSRPWLDLYCSDSGAVKLTISHRHSEPARKKNFESLDVRGHRRVASSTFSRESLKEPFPLQFVQSALVEVFVHVHIDLGPWRSLGEQLQGVAQTDLRYARGKRKLFSEILIGLLDPFGIPQSKALAKHR